MDDVEISVALLSNTESGKRLATLLSDAPVETLGEYKREILEQYTNLWNKYELELGNSILNKEPLSRQAEIRESFIVAMREFDDQIIK
jgi:hypothetical protein